MKIQFLWKKQNWSLYEIQLLKIFNSDLWLRLCKLVNMKKILKKEKKFSIESGLKDDVCIK